MVAPNIATETDRVQGVIDKYRSLGVVIKVSHQYFDEDNDDGLGALDETTISIAFNNKFDAWEIADEIQEELTISPDTGSGFGYRDLQLNRLMTGLN